MNQLCRWCEGGRDNGLHGKSWTVQTHPFDPMPETVASDVIKIAEEAQKMGMATSDKFIKCPSCNINYVDNIPGADVCTHCAYLRIIDGLKEKISSLQAALDVAEKALESCHIDNDKYDLEDAQYYDKELVKEALSQISNLLPGRKENGG